MKNENIRLLKSEALLNMLEDLEEEKRKARESEIKYREVFNSVNDALIMYSVNTRAMVDANKKACKMYGYSVEEFKKQTVNSISLGIHPYTQKGAEELIMKAIQGKPQIFESMAKSKNGKIFPVEINLKRATIGGEDRLLAVLRDITDRKIAEQEAKKAAADLQNIFDALSDYMFIQDKDFRIIKANKAFADLLNTTPDKVIGKKCFEIVHKIKRPWKGCPASKTFRTKKPSFEQIDDPNLGVSLQVSTYPILDEKGKVSRIVHVARNISGKKEIKNKRK